jgi:hypothetical protein
LGLDRLADELLRVIERTLEDFSCRRNRNETFLRAVASYKPLLEELIKELNGAGRNPDILVDI